MKSVKGTRTEQNLLKSFAGESQARSRYTFFAEVAKNKTGCARFKQLDCRLSAGFV